MASATITTPSNFQPVFKRVAQQDRHDDIICVLAMLTGKTAESILRQGETLGLPKVGPYWPFADGDFIARLLASHGLVATVWKDCTSYKEISEVAIASVDANLEWEVARCVLYHRNTSQDGKTAQPYVVDPYPHTDSKLHLRVGTAELNALPPTWYIGVTQMNKGAVK